MKIKINKLLLIVVVVVPLLLGRVASSTCEQEVKRCCKKCIGNLDSIIDIEECASKCAVCLSTDDILNANFNGILCDHL